MMELRELVLKTRSYRRFYEDVPVPRETLRELVDLARQTASAANRQPLKYWLSWEREMNQRIFPCLAWAAYLKDWGGPAEGERPSAYIIILGDTEIAKDFNLDPGIAAQTIMLGATERGFGWCMIASIRKEMLREALNIPERHQILLVLALGKPKEKVVLEPVGPAGDIKYYRDREGVHHVPKRSLDEVILHG